MPSPVNFRVLFKFITGRVERGQLNLNDEVEIVGLKDTKKTVVTGIEMFRKSLDFAQLFIRIFWCVTTDSS